MENRDQQGQQSGDNNQRKLDKNETLQDAGANVPDYGRSEQNERNETIQEGGAYVPGANQPGQSIAQEREQDSDENSAMPLSNDETIGNP